MTISLKFVCLVMATACASLGLGLSSTAYGQGASTAAEHAKEVQPKRQPRLELYRIFIDYVGAEDDEIQMAILAGAKPKPRREYGEEIGISKEEEQTMLAILIDAYCEGGGERTTMHEEVVRTQLVQQYGPHEGQRRYDEVAATFSDSKAFVASKEALAKLQAQLGEESFAKLDKFLREKWLKERWGAKSQDPATDNTKVPSPCPPNNNPPPGQTTHLACIQVYAFLFSGEYATGHCDPEAAVEDQDKDPGTIDYMYKIPVNKLKAVTCIAIAAQRDLLQSWHSPEAPRDQPVAIIEGAIVKLRQELGEEDFMRFDSELAKRNSMDAPSPKGSQTSDQVPAVKP